MNPQELRDQYAADLKVLQQQFAQLQQALQETQAKIYQMSGAIAACDDLLKAKPVKKPKT